MFRTMFSILVLCSTVIGAERPNIVLVMVDDMGWSDLGCYGGEIDTPHIDSLATDGLRFTRFYNNAVCGATRASLLTGLYCQQTGHRGDRWNEPKDFNKCVLISEILQASGYHTAMVGKWQGRDLAVKRGFDRFFGPNCQGKISYWHAVKDNDFYLNDQPWNFPKSDFFMTDAFNDYAVEFLEEAVGRDEPFFLYVGYIAPHWPLHAREETIVPYRERYRKQGWRKWRDTRLRRQRNDGLLPKNTAPATLPKSIPQWSNARHKDWQAERMAVYAAQISNVDRGVGRLLDVLRKSKADKNTLVLFLSDNGAAPNGGLAPTKSGFGFSAGANNRNWRKDGVPIKPGSGPGLMPGPHDTFAGYGIAWASMSYKMTIRNTTILLTVLLLAGGVQARITRLWGYKDLQKDATVIVIASPVSTTDSKFVDKKRPSYMVPIETRFRVQSILKGKLLKQESFKFVHYRLMKNALVKNGPRLANFNDTKKQYLLFLKRRSDGKYEAVSDQMDPVDSIRCLTSVN